MEQFVAWKALMSAGEPTTLWQQFYVLFYQAFIENDRWLQYLNGVVTTPDRYCCQRSFSMNA